MRQRALDRDFAGQAGQSVLEPLRPVPQVARPFPGQALRIGLRGLPLPLLDLLMEINGLDGGERQPHQ